MKNVNAIFKKAAEADTNVNSTNVGGKKKFKENPSWLAQYKEEYYALNLTKDDYVDNKLVVRLVDVDIYRQAQIPKKYKCKKTGAIKQFKETVVLNDDETKCNFSRIIREAVNLGLINKKGESDEEKVSFVSPRTHYVFAVVDKNSEEFKVLDVSIRSKIGEGISQVFLAKHGIDAPPELRGKPVNDDITDIQKGGWLIIEKRKTGELPKDVTYSVSVSPYKEDISDTIGAKTFTTIKDSFEDPDDERALRNEFIEPFCEEYLDNALAQYLGKDNLIFIKKSLNI